MTTTAHEKQITFADAWKNAYVEAQEHAAVRSNYERVEFQGIILPRT